jgi:LysM repeat protein
VTERRRLPHLHPRVLAAALAAAAALFPGQDARAFPHVVKAGETLAQIAERLYGRVEMEQLLVAANGLSAGSGISIVPGMRLEVPAVSHYRVSGGETWPILAERLLGDAERSDVLALANDSMPWLAPADGLEIIIPYNLRYVAEQGDSTLTVAYRFLGERDKAWMLDRYNRLKGDPIRRGDVLLVPLTQLPLTPAGKAEAANAGALVRAEGTTHAREAQRKADAELPQLAADVQKGRYVDAIARGNKLLGYGDLARPQLAAIHRQLTEAYVALDASGLAETACAAWREADPAARIDPVDLSPKIVRVCTAAAVSPSALPQGSAAPNNAGQGAAAPNSAGGAAPDAGPRRSLPGPGGAGALPPSGG